MRWLSFVIGYLFIAGFPCNVAVSQMMSWPHPDGPEWNRISRERRLDLQWKENSVLWQLNRLAGDQTPLILQNKLYLLNYQLENETIHESIVCLKVASLNPNITFRDAEPWFEIPLQTIAESKLNQTSKSVIVGDQEWRQLFALTSSGRVIAWDSDLGSEMWQVSLTTLFPDLDISPQQVSTPVLFENLLIIQLMTNEQRVLLALDRRNGSVFWYEVSPCSQDQLPDLKPATYDHQIVLFSSRQPGQIDCHQIRTGRKITSIRCHWPNATVLEMWPCHQKLLVIQQRDEDHSYAAEILQLNSDREKQKPGFRHVFNDHERVTGLINQRYAYFVTTQGKLIQLDLDFGEFISRHDVDAASDHQMIWADQQLLVVSTAGEWSLWKETDQTLNEIQRKQLDSPVYALPVISQQRLYLRSRSSLYCVTNREWGKAVSDLIDPLSEIAQDDRSQDVAQILLTPSRATLKQDQTQPFHLLLFNQYGAYLGQATPDQVKLEWSGPGRIDSESMQVELSGKLEDSGLQSLHAKYNDLEAAATIIFDRDSAQ